MFSFPSSIDKNINISPFSTPDLNNLVCASDFAFLSAELEREENG